MLIRHVLCSMMMHLFYVLNPPSIVIHHLERIFTRFLWGEFDIKRQIHWSGGLLPGRRGQTEYSIF